MILFQYCVFPECLSLHLEQYTRSPPISVAPIIYPSPEVITLVSEAKMRCYQNNYIVSKDQKIMTLWIAQVAGTDEILSHRNSVFILKFLVKCVRKRRDGHERK